MAEIHGPRRAKSCVKATVEVRGEFETTQEPAKSAVELEEAKAKDNFPLFDCQLDQG